MPPYVSDIAFSPAVKAAQERYGSRKSYERMEQGGGWQDKVTPELATFLSERDSFYLGTTSAAGQPYIQHRGGPKGFLKVVDERTLGFADFVGNAQYISVGNLDENSKATLFLMDYPNRRRVKVWGNAKVVEENPDLLSRLTDDHYSGKVQRAVLFTIAAWDVNCPQHITPRWTEEDISPTIDSLRKQVSLLEQEIQQLRGSGASSATSH